LTELQFELNLPINFTWSKNLAEFERTKQPDLIAILNFHIGRKFVSENQRAAYSQVDWWNSRDCKRTSHLFSI